MPDLSTLQFMGGLALCTALVQVCKRWVKDSSLYPLIAMGIGILLNIAVGLRLGTDLVACVFAGIIVGLYACGIYSVGGTGQPVNTIDSAQLKTIIDRLEAANLKNQSLRGE